MIKDPELPSFWIVGKDGKSMEVSDDIEKLLVRAKSEAHNSGMRIDVVHYLGSFYPVKWLPETLKDKEKN